MMIVLDALAAFFDLSQNLTLQQLKIYKKG